MPAPTLDGTATAQGTNALSYVVTLTTTQANDIICVLVYTEVSSGTNCPSITSVTASGLTFVKRTNASVGGVESMELWWAKATTALSAKVITVAFSGGYDDSACVAFGINGCNLVNPWDGNTSLPKAYQPGGNNTAPVSGVSTNGANNYLIYAVGSRAGWGSIGTVPTGFAQIGFRFNGGGGLFASAGVAGQGITVKQSNASFAWGSSIPQNPAGQAIFDSLTADAAGSANSARPQVFVCT